MILIGTVVIPGRTASANAIDVMRLRKKLAYKKNWRDWTHLACLGAKNYHGSVVNGKAFRRVVVTGYRTRICDEENFTRGLKPVFDGLVQAKWLYDDGPKYCSREYHQVQSKDEKVVIEVYE